MITRSSSGKALACMHDGSAAGARMTHTYYTEFSRNEEAGVWCVSRTDVPGLAAEAAAERNLVLGISAPAPEFHELNRPLLDQSMLDPIPLRMTSMRQETIRVRTDGRLHEKAATGIAGAGSRLVGRGFRYGPRIDRFGETRDPVTSL